MLQYLRDPAPGDEVARADAVRSLCDLAERFAPDHAWFVETMNELFEVAGEHGLSFLSWGCAACCGA